MEKLPVAAGVIVIAALSLFLVAGNTMQVPYTAMVTYTEQEPYTETECHDIQVPYTENVCGDIQVPYSEEECHDIQVPYSEEDCVYEDYSYAVENVKRWYDLFGYYWISFDIVNHEDKGGYFYYETTFHTLNYGDKTRGTTSYIYANSRITYPQLGYKLNYFGQEVSADNPRITPPQKQICSESTNYRTEQQCETVTKYRTEQTCEDTIKLKTETQCEDVIKYRSVEKQRGETRYKTLFDYWFGS